MRLAQAARKFSMTTEDIVDFLEIRGVKVEKDSNTKLDEEAVKILLKHFDVEEEPAEPTTESSVADTPEYEAQLEEPATLESEQEVEVQSDGVYSEEENEQKSDEVVESIEAAQEEEAHSLENEEQVQDESIKESQKPFKTVGELLESGDIDQEEDFVIKPAKVELKGLNVLGKIDLPEPKPKPDAKKGEVSNRKSDRVNRKTDPKKNSRRREKRELTPAEIRKREDQKAERKRQRLEKERKKKREEFYKEKILKPKQIEQKNKPQKPKKIKEEITKSKKSKPKTILGKVWRWLNT